MISYGGKIPNGQISWNFKSWQRIRVLSNICHKIILHLKEGHMLTFLLKTISHPQSIASIFQYIFHGEPSRGFIILKNALRGAVSDKILRSASYLQ